MVPITLQSLVVAYTGAGAASLWIPLLTWLLVLWVGVRVCKKLDSDMSAVQALVAIDADAELATVAPDRMATAEGARLKAAVEGLLERVAGFRQAEASTVRSIEEAQRLRLEFLASMGHDLRNPLSSIVGFADLMEMEGLDDVGSEQRESVAIIRRSASDLLTLLDQILDWAKLEAGRIELDTGPVAAAAVIHEALNKAAERTHGRGLVVLTDGLEALPTLQCDRERIVQALLGVLDHAIRTEDGPTIHLRARCEFVPGGRGSLRIEIEDPGLAIRRADRDSFFEGLRPSFAPSGKRIAGLGLGPALARTLFRAHGGDVSVDSGSQSGTTFTLTLPLVDAGEGPQAHFGHTCTYSGDAS